MSEDRTPPGMYYAGSKHGMGLATHNVAVWLENEPGLLERAREIVAKGGDDLLRQWVTFLWYGAPEGGFNLNDEPKHDSRIVLNLKTDTDRDAFRRIDWQYVRESVNAE
jgi:hypothetical protein